MYSVARTAMDLSEEYDHATMRVVPCVILGCPCYHDKRSAAKHLMKCGRMKAIYTAIKEMEKTVLMATHKKLTGNMFGAVMTILKDEPELRRTIAPWPLFRFNNLEEAAKEAARLSEWKYGAFQTQDSSDSGESDDSE
jgi:hypothetical protein